MRNLKRVSVVLLLSVAGVGFAAETGKLARASDLLPPVRIEAGGKPVLANGRCCTATMADFDGDGKLDLLVGQMSDGGLRIYPNIGTIARPEFSQATDFMAAGERAFVPAGCYTTFNAQLGDFDGDGRTDMLSASFDNGIYLFRATAEGTFARAEVLEDRLGRPYQYRYNGAVVACDWDGDGDLDLVTRGNPATRRGGGVYVIINAGSRQKPLFDEPRALTAENKPLFGKPCAVVDWDGDGKDDLVTCSGGVYCHRNTGEKGLPVLQPAELLVPSGKYETLERRPDEPRRMPDAPGRIDSVCVADVNGDGRLDLVAVSTWCESVALPDPTDEQRAAAKELNDRANALARQYRELSKAPAFDESREARSARECESLRLWRKSAELRAASQAYSPRHDYACVWFFERTGADSRR